MTLHFMISAGGALARSTLLLKGEPEDHALRDLAILARLLRAGGRDLGTGGRHDLIRAVSGLRARVVLKGSARGSATIEEVRA